MRGVPFAVDYFSFSYEPPLDRGETVMQGLGVRLMLPPAGVMVSHRAGESSFELDAAGSEAPVLLGIEAELHYRAGSVEGERLVHEAREILCGNLASIHPCLCSADGRPVLRFLENPTWLQATPLVWTERHVYEFVEGEGALRAATLTPDKLVELSRVAQAVLDWLIARQEQLDALSDQQEPPPCSGFARFPNASARDSFIESVLKQEADLRGRWFLSETGHVIVFEDLVFQQRGRLQAALEGLGEWFDDVQFGTGESSS